MGELVCKLLCHPIEINA